jgi:hypothetical protein
MMIRLRGTGQEQAESELPMLAKTDTRFYGRRHFQMGSGRDLVSSSVCTLDCHQTVTVFFLLHFSIFCSTETFYDTKEGNTSFFYYTLAIQSKFGFIDSFKSIRIQIKKNLTIILHSMSLLSYRIL